MDGISVVEYIKSHKIKAVEEIDLEKSTIKYSNFIKNSSRISKITGEEELVRAFLVTKFVNELDYKLENIEFEKEYNIGRPKVKKARIDIILRDITGNPFLFIELKSPSEYEKEKEEAIKGQLYQLAFLEEKEFNTKIKYLVYYTYDAQNEDLRDLATIIDFSKFHNYDAWEEALYPSVSDEIPARYEKAQKEPYKKGSKRDLETNFSPETLNALRTNLHDVLWGGGGTDDNEIFSSLVNIILAKIEDESDKTNGQEYEFQVYSYGKGDQEELENNEDLYDRINDLYRRALKKRLNVEERLVTKANIINEEKFSLNKLRYTVQQLERFSFVDGKNSYNGKDILGDFFEGIIRDGFKQTKGQFFTPPPIVTFLLYALELDNLAIDKLNNNSDLPYIIDPSAGSGTFLIEAMKFVTDIIKYKRKNDLKDSRDVEDKFHEYFMPDHRENKWAREFIYGSEINFNLGTATKVNMILHGDGSTNIFVKDGLSPFKMFVKESAPNFLNKYINDDLYHNKEVNKEFDAVISNPPFSVSLDKETQKHLNKEFLFSKKKNSENLFIERWYQLLRENGRFGVVLPESVFDTTENKYIRLFLYKYFKIKAVV
ncbi:MAG: N-6 DNA methylase, partial [Nanoarchaeota archaeon]|nr:N-6 DNA methylase [Nanoarchaeota archaeon]